SFDETTIIAYTDYGELTINGTSLHICKLNIEDGELSVEGNIVSMTYIDHQPKNQSFFGKIFR
ncbi:MAG: YabP/YqfC family sporulation protein, partial [Acutalibacteraceae bacterium]